jgi:ketosteroid isomerase-like protein
MERSTDLENWVRETYSLMERGDVEAMAGAMSTGAGVLMIGTDPEEWWQGHEAVLEAFGAETEAMGGGLALVGGDPVAYVEGDVGWVADRPAFRLPDGGEVPTRLTGVLRREDGGWRWVQAHFSIGVANEEAFGRELPG